ncbi:hypothetical protein KUCAC02_025876 [Chaenocephalus aceratus]|uniref:Uncharacterized protein n=1 Tax=Chaenocephalus aceratus TaxID=36190 RepID=A0ACB9VWZ0_CHAAC|nr:hypothetical protein KUCAC02_025876 [Chaenocephalus aceratus]
MEKGKKRHRQGGSREKQNFESSTFGSFKEDESVATNPSESEVDITDQSICLSLEDEAQHNVIQHSDGGENADLDGSLVPTSLKPPPSESPSPPPRQREEKRTECRSVLATGLEKPQVLHQPGEEQPAERAGRTSKKKPVSEGAGSYFHLNHSELVALLVQREAELERQGGRV